jgi:hypothetical protein
MRFLKEDNPQELVLDEEEDDQEEEWAFQETEDYQEDQLLKTTSLADIPGQFRVEELDGQIRGFPQHGNDWMTEDAFPSKLAETRGNEMMLEDLFFAERQILEDDNYSFCFGMDQEEITENNIEPNTQENKCIREPLDLKIPGADFEIFSHFGEAGGKVPPEIRMNRPYCNCSKSQCLKLYCLCFRKGVACHKSCNCTGCLNVTDNQENVKLKRSHKIARNMSEADVSCNCKMSFCEKSYCACNRSGKGCSSLCKCFHCKNQFGSKF